MTKRARARQDDVKRAVAGTIAGGERVARVIIDPSGKIIIITGRDSQASADDHNPWDDE